MVPTPPEANERRSQRGFALVLAIFLLALVSTLGLIIGGNGLFARKSARTSSYRAAVIERAALATWMTADALERSQKSPHFIFTVEGRELSATVSLESGRIDLNGLPTGGVSQAIEELGYEPATAQQAAANLSNWRGALRPVFNGSTAGLPDARRAFWSIDDLDAVTDLAPGLRNCLKIWGTAHARGAFLGSSLEQAWSLTSDTGGSENIAPSSLLRIVVSDQFSGLKFRSILLYGGGRLLNDPNSSPWRIMEWLSPTEDLRCETQASR